MASIDQIESILFRQNVELLRSLRDADLAESRDESLIEFRLTKALAQARRNHARTRVLGHGLLGTGVAATLGSLVSYAASKDLGMSSQEVVFLLGGIGLIASGHARYEPAHRARERSDRLSLDLADQ